MKLFVLFIRTDFKKKFEQAPDKTSSIEEARKARAEKDRLDRERVKAEQDSKRSKVIFIIIYIYFLSIVSLTFILTADCFNSVCF
jgi:pyruvate/2-oxoglutarate dehydrogenase complex dihydrolipoamide acyltransferase (E2) component